MPVSLDQIKKGSRVKSLNFGWMEVVSDPYPSELQNGCMKVDVRFDDTGTVRKGVVDRYFVGGYVRDGSVDASKMVGTQYNTFECGVVEIIDFKRTKDITVKFLNTGNTQSVQFDALVTGVIADQLLQVSKREEKHRLRQQRLDEQRRIADLRKEREAQRKEAKEKIVADRKAKHESERARIENRLKQLYDRKAEKLANLDKILKVGVKELDQERATKDSLNIDFKDRDGNWVLRFSMNGKFIQTRLGKLHNNMTQRANKDGAYQKIHKSYEGVSLSEMFQDAQKFCDWVVQQRGWGYGYHLDKDLLCAGNKVYSESTCVFLPSEINTALIPSRKTVVNTRSDGFYEVHFSLGGEDIIVPGFETKDEALDAYRKYREAYVRKLAMEYKESISEPAFEAMLSWKLSVTD